MIAPVLSQIAEAAGLHGLPIPHEAHKTTTRQVSCAGKKKSLFVGCNYVGTQNELKGCVNDVKRMLPVIEQLGFPSDSQFQQVLLDSGSEGETKPTHANMLKALKWLVDGAQAGDSLFFHYSGHGGQEPASGTSDGYHETLVPLDFQSAGMLKDTDLFEVLIKPLPSGCRLTCILDSCHSAGALNLPFRFVGSEAELKKGLASDAAHMVMSHGWANDAQLWKDGKKVDVLKDIGAMGMGLWKLKKAAADGEGGDSTGYKVEEQQNQDLHIGEVVAFTGCRSDQTSADVGDVNQQFHLKAIEGDSRGSLVIDSQRDAVRGSSDSAGGALTTALLEALQNSDSQQMSYLELLDAVRKELSSQGFSQVPQVTTSLIVDLKDSFALDTISVPVEDSAQPQQSQEQTQNGVAAANKHEDAGANPLSGFISSLSSNPQGAAMLQQGASAFQNYMKAQAAQGQTAAPESAN